MRCFIFLLLLLKVVFYSNFVLAGSWVDSYSASIGGGSPNGVRGGRIALQNEWDKNFVFMDERLSLGGYWDLSAAYWQINTSHLKPEHLFAFAFAPVFRLQVTQPWTEKALYPFMEGSVGVSYLTEKGLGRRSFGSKFAFQDLIGLGIQFGKAKNYELSYHFLHYSNASLYKPNQGIDIKALLTFRHYLY